MEDKAFTKFLGYISLKWICFYVYQFLEPYATSDWHLSWQLPNIKGVFLAVLMILFLPFLELIVLAWPFELALRQRGWRTVIILILAFIVEFFLNWSFTNQQIETWMIVKIIGSIILYLFLYRRQLSALIQRPTF